MPDCPSSPEADPADDTSRLPDNFSLVLKPRDFDRVTAAARRHAGGCPPTTFHVSFHEGDPTWKFSQANVVMWFSDTGAIEPPATGHLTLPVHFFQSIEDARLGGDNEDVRLEVDLGADTLTYVANHCRISTTLPEKTDPPVVPDWQRTSRIFMNSTYIAQVGAFLASDPIGSADDEDFSGIAPFIQFSFDGDQLTLTRDWSPHGGPVLTMAVEAGGNFRGSFSMFAEVFAREIFLVDVFTEGVVSFEFYDGEPHVCRVTGPHWGLVAHLGHEHVFEYRRSLEMSLQFSDAELVVEHDTRTGWDPTVVVTAGSRTVRATLIPGQNGLGHHVRLSTDIASDIPWSNTLAAEVNAWNDRWPTVKLVHVDGVLRAIADMPVSAMPAMAGAVVDLADKAQVVDDLIAAVL